MAAFATASFNNHMRRQFEGVEADQQVDNLFVPRNDINDVRLSETNLAFEKIKTHVYSKRTLEKIRGGMALFDSRLFVVGDAKTALQCISWRQNGDCRRNGAFGLARAFFSTAQLHKHSTPKCLAKLDSIGVNYDDMDDQYRFGVFGKREQYEIDAVDPRQPDKPTNIKALRTRAKAISKQLSLGDENKQSVCNWLEAKCNFILFF